VRVSGERLAQWPLVFVRFGALLWAAVIAVGLGILCTPEPAKQPLLPKDGWLMSNVCRDDWRPPVAEVSSAIVNNAENRFFTSWSPTGPVAGTVRSRPFE